MRAWLVLLVAVGFFGCASEHAGNGTEAEQVPPGAFDQPYDDEPAAPDAGSVPGMTTTEPDAKISQADAATPSADAQEPAADAAAVAPDAAAQPTADAETPAPAREWFEGRSVEVVVQYSTGDLRNPYYGTGKEKQTWRFSRAKDGTMQLARDGFPVESARFQDGAKLLFWDSAMLCANGTTGQFHVVLGSEKDFSASYSAFSKSIFEVGTPSAVASFTVTARWL